MNVTIAAIRSMAVTLCCVLLLAGCAQVGVGCCADLQPLPPPVQGPYRLDTGDTVRVIVYNQQSLSTDYVVSDSGTISVPTLGEVRARGLTVQDVQKEIFDGLNSGVLVNPGVSAQLVQYRPIYIVGEVNKPGQYPYTVGLNVLGAVAVAGGYTVRADSRRMSVVRGQMGRSIEWRASPLADVQPGDVVVIHEQFF